MNTCCNATIFSYLFAFANQYVPKLRPFGGICGTVSLLTAITCKSNQNGNAVVVDFTSVDVKVEQTKGTSGSTGGHAHHAVSANICFNVLVCVYIFVSAGDIAIPT